VQWLRDQQFEVYQEVEGPRGRADIVATCGPLVAVVELKVTLSFELLWQARRWRSSAHQVWVGVPQSKRHDTGRSEAEWVFGQYGIGILSVDGEYVGESSRPAFNRRADVARLRAVLCPEQQSGAEAGTNRGGQWTPFKKTCRALHQHAKTNPGALLGEAIKSIQHHYASDAGARARLSELIQRGVVKGIRLERDGRALRVFAEGS